VDGYGIDYADIRAAPAGRVKPRPAITPRLTRPTRHPKIAAMVATVSQPWFTLDVVLTFDFPHA